MERTAEVFVLQPKGDFLSQGLQRNAGQVSLPSYQNSA